MFGDQIAEPWPSSAETTQSCVRVSVRASASTTCRLDLPRHYRRVVSWWCSQQSPCPQYQHRQRRNNSYMDKCAGK